MATASRGGTVTVKVLLETLILGVQWFSLRNAHKVSRNHSLESWTIAVRLRAVQNVAIFTIGQLCNEGVRPCSVGITIDDDVPAVACKQKVRRVFWGIASSKNRKTHHDPMQSERANPLSCT